MTVDLREMVGYQDEGEQEGTVTGRQDGDAEGGAQSTQTGSCLKVAFGA